MANLSTDSKIFPDANFWVSKYRSGKESINSFPSVMTHSIHTHTKNPSNGEEGISMLMVKDEIEVKNLYQCIRGTK